MNKLDIVNAVQNWTKNRFVFRSSFYTGRGPNRGDLNSEKLEQIYQRNQSRDRTERSNSLR